MEERHQSFNDYMMGYDGRLAKLETVVESLATNINRLTNDVSMLANYSRDRSRTNWGNIFAGGTLVVALVAGYVGLPLNHVKENFEAYRLQHQEWADDQLVDMRRATWGLRDWKEGVQAQHLPRMQSLYDQVERQEQADKAYHETLQSLATQTGRMEEKLSALERRMNLNN